MRLSAHHRAQGDEVSFRWAANRRAVCREMFERPERVYASLIFERTRPLAEDSNGTQA
jgi:hypothetical protein